MLRVIMYVSGLILATVCLLATVPRARGDCGHVSRVRYAPAHVVAVKRVVAVRRVVAFDVPQYYYSTSDYGSATSQSVLADAAAFRALQLLLQAQQAPQQSYTAPAVQAAPEACQTCQTQPGNGIALQQATPQWHQQLAGVVKQSCVSCHTNQNGVDLSNLSTVTPAQRGACYGAVKYGAMPKGHPRMPAATVRLFQLWAQSK